MAVFPKFCAEVLVGITKLNLLGQKMEGMWQSVFWSIHLRKVLNAV